MISKDELRWIQQHCQTKNLFNRSPIPLSHTKLDRMIQRRSNGMPLQYLLKTQPFLSLELYVRKPVLIPRWETEQWTETLIQRLDSQKQLRILEIGTGSGCIGLSLSKYLDCHVISIDQSPKAVKLARLNQRKHNITNIEILEMDLFDLKPFPHQFDLIVSNPPYIPPSEYESLDPQVKDWEDKAALLSNDLHGIQFYEKILSLKHLLTPRPIIKFAFEIGHLQAPHLSHLGQKHNYSVEILNDYAKKTRAVFMTHH
ncbi:S-adenosyl-L-methionine-dependent methyltransferase [Gorgonomyces haynaldii]|nr:S-adenosyl-L-methionine-dependent methyltransferase [Gorgonomyces haynaldii]